MSTSEEILNNYISATASCAGNFIITKDRFLDLSVELSENSDNKTSEEILKILNQMSLKFTACGGNNGEKYAVVMRYPVQHWKYLIVAIKKA